MPHILAGRPVMLAYLYGSAAEGYARPFSDVDIALVLSPEPPLSARERLWLELDIAAEIERRCGIGNADVRSINQSPLVVQGKVVTEGLLLYSRDETFRIEYEVYTRKLYLDFRPVICAMREAYFAHLEAQMTRRGEQAGG